MAAGFSYAINWGDGSGVAIDHAYTAPGSYTVQVTATDKDAGASIVANRSLTVQTVQMQGGTLAVGGTLGNDTITLSPADAAEKQADRGDADADLVSRQKVGGRVRQVFADAPGRPSPQCLLGASAKT